MTPTEDLIEEALDLISRGSVQSAYFFDSLQDPDWIEPLCARGFFSSPPEPVATDEGFMHLPWPESRYLKRMAPRAPRAVAEAIEDFQVTPNERVMIDVCEIGTELDLKSQRRIGIAMRQSLTEAKGHFLLLPEAMADLAVSISRNGDIDFARCFASDLLEISAPDQRSALDPRVETRIRGGDYERVLERVTSQLAPADPLGIFMMLCRLLDRALDQSKGERAPNDYSHYWREDIGENPSRSTEQALQSLISAIRDVALKQKQSPDPEIFRAMEADLQNRSWAVFKRLLYFIEAQPPLIDMDFCRNLIFTTEFTEEPFLIREHDRLASTLFPFLPLDEQAKYLEKINSGSGNQPSDDTDLDHRREDVWRRDRLHALSGSLSDMLEAELKELMETYGPPQPSMFVRRGSEWSGRDSPINEEEIARMPAEDLVDFLDSWVSPEGSMNPSPEGVARLLTKQVEERPQEFGRLTVKIESLDPTYVRAVIEGFEKALTAGSLFDWEPVLTLMERALADPATSENEHALEDRDPDWGWAKRSSASLLQKAFESEIQIVVDPDRTWKVLDELSWDPEPTHEYEEQFGGDNMDPLTLSLNTTRGQAMHAVMAAAMWSKRNENEGLRNLALSNLHKHLNPDSDSSETIRGVFGSWLAPLQNQFPKWFDEHLEAILPPDEDKSHLRSVVWDTFLAWNHPNRGLWFSLREEYRKSIASLPDSEAKVDGIRRSTGEALAEHLASYIWWGLIDLDRDPEVQEFFAKAKVEHAIRLIQVLGTSLLADENQPVDSAVIEKVVQLWKQLPGWIELRSDEDRGKLLGSFGELYVVEALVESLGDDELLRLIKAGIVSGPEHLVLPRVAERVWTSPEAPLRFATAFAENPPTPWSIDSYERELQMIIEGGIEAGGTHRAQAELVVNLLVAKGHTSFRGHIDPV